MKTRDYSKNVCIALIPALLWVCLCGPVEGARFSWDRYENKDQAWYRSAAGRRAAQNILSWQDEYGCWPKNMDSAAKRFSGDRKKLDGTFDNNATTGELRFLARAYNATQEAACKEAFIRGLDVILKAQYPTGGWPQSYPPGKGYPRHITFNDGVMVRLMEFLREVTDSPDYDFIGASRRAAVRKAFDRGIECILNCQIRVQGKLAVWCAQHDELDYRPRAARSYELVSLSGGESAGILELLMSLEEPTPGTIRAVTAGVEWYKASAVEGIRLKRIEGERMAVKDPAAPLLWGRFYEIKTNRPIFCDRDGIPTYDYNQISRERRNGYSWFGDWGEDVFRDYDKWRQKWEGLLVSAGTRVLAIIGDSTVCEFPESDNRRGWGQYIQEYFTDDLKVINRARSGRSTKTFIREGLWKQVLAQQPDYVLIQFGHNDSHDPENPESTDARTDYRDYLRQYIDESRGIGTVPVLVTSMHRRKFDEQGNLKDILQPYADAMKAVGQKINVSVVDLHTASGELFKKLGDSGSMALANAPDDRTHFNEKGARAMARLVMAQLPQREPSLKPYLKKQED